MDEFLENLAEKIGRYRRLYNAEPILDQTGCAFIFFLTLMDFSRKCETIEEIDQHCSELLSLLSITSLGCRICTDEQPSDLYIALTHLCPQSYSTHALRALNVIIDDLRNGTAGEQNA